MHPFTSTFSSVSTVRLSSPGPQGQLGAGLSGLSEALHDLSAAAVSKTYPRFYIRNFLFSAVSLHPFLAHIGAESRFLGLSQCFRLLCGSARIKLFVKTYLRFVQFAFSLSPALYLHPFLAPFRAEPSFLGSARVYECFWFCLH